MKRNITNAVYGVFDYASYPVGMMLAAPLVLHRMGAAQYGLWMIATSVISAGGIAASGFSDAGIQYIAKLRSKKATESIEDVARTLLAINFSLGCALALLTWVLAPYAADRLAIGHGLVPAEATVALRVAGAAILIRAIETVPVCIQRAYEEYRGTVQISVIVRLVTLCSAIAIAAAGGRATGIMWMTTVLLGAGTACQFYHLRQFVDLRRTRPDFHIRELQTLFRSGAFVWLQSLSSVIFRQLDRIILGIYLGAASVVPYSMSIQVSEPLFGLTASCLSFFFPYLSGRAGTLSPRALRRTVLKALLFNLALVSAGATLLMIFGGRFMRAWVGGSVEQSTHPILPLIIIGSALSGLSVVGTYASQALGMFRAVASISIAGRGFLLLLMLLLLQHGGLHGLAIARVCYGAATLLVYVPLARKLEIFRKERAFAVIPFPVGIQEGEHL